MSLGGWADWCKELIDGVIAHTGIPVSPPEPPIDVLDTGRLGEWLERPDVIEQFDRDASRWVLPAPVGVALKAPPVTHNYAHVGTAFDYAMRCLLSLWNGVDLSGRLRPQEGYIPVFVPSTIVAYGGCGQDKRRLGFLDSFYSRLNSYTSRSRGTDEDEERDFILSLLPDCVILANLESVYRSGQDYGNDAIFSVNPGDVADLAVLLKLVDRSTWVSKGKTFGKIVHPSLDFAQYDVPCFLNPSFGESSQAVGGGDADIILDGCLIDIKTVQSTTKRYKDYVRQLIGYWILNLREGDPYGITSLGIYFSRHGLLHRFPLPVVGDVLIRKDKKGRGCPISWGKKDVASLIWDTIEDSFRQYNGEDDEDEDVGRIEGTRYVDYWEDPFSGLLLKELAETEELCADLVKVASDLFDTVGHTFDPMDDTQSLIVLYEELGLPKTGGGLADRSLRRLTHPAGKLVARYRQLWGIAMLYHDAKERVEAGEDQ